tara:strand:- start:1702 stop:1869 length:168 start_codon:yes stop_codon:yes gene_type:complete
MKEKEMMKIIMEIEENINICCNASMDSEDVLELIDKLKVLVEAEKEEGGSNLEKS